MLRILIYIFLVCLGFAAGRLRSPGSTYVGRTADPVAAREPDPPVPAAPRPEPDTEFRTLLPPPDWPAEDFTPEPADTTTRIDAECLERAHLHGLPPSVQARIDGTFPWGSVIRLGGNFLDLHEDYDLSAALFERLVRSPYTGIEYDIAELPAEHHARIADALKSLAEDSPATAVEAMGVALRSPAVGDAHCYRGVLRRLAFDVGRESSIRESAAEQLARAGFLHEVEPVLIETFAKLLPERFPPRSLESSVVGK